jgi:5-formyltetrahydrofolate cyclo-ligase
MRQILRNHAPEAIAVSTVLDQWLLAHPECRTIAVYSPLPGEIDLTRTLLTHPERRWVFPRVADHHLTFHTGGNLIHGSFGVLEPAADSPEVPLLEVDAFLCPGLAFDKNGGRLGRGRGFYDRLLAQARPDALKLGICHSFQIVADTYPEPHDIPMDELIDEG